MNFATDPFYIQLRFFYGNAGNIQLVQLLLLPHKSQGFCGNPGISNPRRK